MRKYRRGSKLVQFLTRRFRHLDKTQKNNEQLPVSPETTSQGRVAEDVVYGYQLPTTDQRQQNRLYGPAQQPNTSNQLPISHNDVHKPLGIRLQPATSMELLYDDLYLTDSSDDEMVADERTKSPLNSAILPPFKSMCGVEKNLNNRNNSEEIIKLDNVYNSDRESVNAQNKNPNWKKNIRKNKRQLGEPYISAKGVLVPGKTLIDSKCRGKCIHRCTSMFNEEQRLDIFSSFWNISTVEQKRLYIINLIHREKIKGSNSKSKKKYMNKYFLKKSNENEKIRVCQKFFIATLNVSETFVRYCFKKVIDNMVVGDKRGKHTPHNKKPKEIREHVRNHIKSFPRMPPPRVRKDSKREYLSRNLNLTKMHFLYQIKCDREQRESVELAYYRSVFNKDFNIGFHRPGRDICGRCLFFEKMNKNEKESQKQERVEHVNRINNARQYRNEARSLAQLGEIHFAEYDLKTISEYPSSSRLKRTLHINSFTILDFHKANRNVLCYFWPKGIASKGSTEIGSCIYKYIQSNADGKSITFMTNTCASQCKNMYISSLLLYCIEIFDIPEINQIYFEQGHSQLETDNIHVDIEKTKKNMKIFQLSDFYNVFTKALQRYPNVVSEMRANDFIDLKYLKNIIIKNAKIDHNGVPVNWQNIRWLQYRKENTNIIYFRYELDDTEFNKIEVIRRGKRRQNCEDIVLLKKSFMDPNPFY